MLFAACLLYPDLVVQLINKVFKQQLNTDVRKSYFKGHQASKWSQILTHPLFADIDQDFLCYEWVSEKEDSDHQQTVRQKVYSIFLERSSVLFAGDANLLWMKQTIGQLLNSIDEGKIDQVEFISKVISLSSSPPPFYLDRYTDLKIADFTEDVTTINPADLLGNNEQ